MKQFLFILTMGTVEAVIIVWLVTCMLSGAQTYTVNSDCGWEYSCDTYCSGQGMGNCDVVESNAKKNENCQNGRCICKCKASMLRVV